MPSVKPQPKLNLTKGDLPTNINKNVQTVQSINAYFHQNPTRFSPDLQRNLYKSVKPAQPILPPIHQNPAKFLPDLQANLYKNVHPAQSFPLQSHQNPIKESSADLLTQWKNQQLQAQQMAINQMKNANYFNDAGNIQQIASTNAEMPQNVRRHGKGLMSEIGGGDESLNENGPHPKVEPKLMQSAISASHRPTILWQGRKQYLEQNIRKHEIDHELIENHVEKKQKLAPENWTPIPLHWQEHRQQEHDGFPTANGNIINQGIEQIDEHGGSQNELAHQFISSGFNRQRNLPKMNADIGGWQQNLHENMPIQKTAKMPSTFEALGPQNYGKTSSNTVALPSEEQYFTGY
jgi:hypothetical protein